MRYVEMLYEYRANTDMWISPEGKVHYDLAPPPELADQNIKQGWIWAKANPDGSIDARHKYATRYAYDTLKSLIRQHDAQKIATER